jgi:hypothetical protein
MVWHHHNLRGESQLGHTAGLIPHDNILDAIPPLTRYRKTGGCKPLAHQHYTSTIGRQLRLFTKPCTAKLTKQQPKVRLCLSYRSTVELGGDERKRGEQELGSIDEETAQVKDDDKEDSPQAKSLGRSVCHRDRMKLLVCRHFEANLFNSLYCLYNGRRMTVMSRLRS